MRVTGGESRGIPLQVPPRVTRPTTDRVREAMFSILGSRAVGASVLDLFSGSGALGIEALSRGAERVVFVERDRQAAAVIGRNLKKARLTERARVYGGDVFSWLKKYRPSGSGGGKMPEFDVTFADPPYLKEPAGRGKKNDLALNLLSSLSPACCRRLVLETEAGRTFSAEDLADWQIEDERTYGSTRLWFFHREEHFSSSL